FSHGGPGDYKNGDGLTVPFTSQNLNSGLFKMGFALPSDQTLKLGAVVYHNSFFANSYNQDLDSNTYTLKYTYRPRDNPFIDFALNVGANDVQTHYLNNRPAVGLGSAAGRIIQDQGLGFDVTNTPRFKFGDVRIAATYGYEFFQDDVDASNK